MRAVILLATLVFVGLQYTYWFGENGYFELRNLKHDLHVQIEVNRRLEERNNRLRQEIAHVNNEPAAMEEIARSRLGMVKHGETFYLVDDLQ